MKKVIAVLVLVAATGWIFREASLRYERPAHKMIDYHLVEHPEFIPKAEHVRLVASGYDNFIADSYWLSAIQYVGSNAVNAEYKRYLYQMLDLVTDLNPAFDYPYEMGLLLIPDFNPRYEKFNADEVKLNVENSVKLGLKGIALSCDAKKIDAILKEEHLNRVWTSPEYASPCRNPMIPYYLGYVEYWNRKNPDKASDYYRIASANPDAPTGARIMSAIMKGKSGNREKAILMFLSIAESVDPNKASECKAAAGELRNVLISGLTPGATIPSGFIKKVEAVRVAIGETLNETLVIWDSGRFCSNYLNKAVREINLEYLSRAESAFIAKGGKPVTDGKALLDVKAIDYLPSDFQKLDGEGEIIYVKDEKTGTWDYVAGKY